MLENALLLAGAVYLLNIIPAFAPPTWMAMSFIGMNNPDLNPLAVALLAAAAATSGRLTLAWGAKWIVRDHLMRATTRTNIDVLKRALERHRGATAGGILLFAFSPVPSNYLFMAYGLTALPLWLVAAPFFVGRCVSYSLWIYAAQQAAHSLDIEHLLTGSYLGGYFVLSQVVFLSLVWLLTRIDWAYLIQTKKLRLTRKAV